MTPGTRARLGAYLLVVSLLEGDGAQRVSSRRLGDICDVNDSQVRRDLLLVRVSGTRGVGYRPGELARGIGRALAAGGATGAGTVLIQAVQAGQARGVKDPLWDNPAWSPVMFAADLANKLDTLAEALIV